MRLLLAIAVVLALATAAQARSTWGFELGIGEQQPAFFDDPRFLAIGIEHVRFVTAWDVGCRASADRERLQTWLAGARRSGARPLIAFSFSSRPSWRWRLPAYRTFMRCFRDFRRRWPHVRDFNPWNEANHSAQPTFRHPKKAAGFYNAMRRVCRRCAISAGDVLDWSHLVRWLERYRAHLRGRPRLWSMHNYIDVNRPRGWRSSGTLRVLRMTRGRLWISETAGVVQSRRYSTYDERRAAAATRRMFALARRSGRIARLYGYQWQAGCGPYGWDSGWFRSNGSPRPAWRVVVREVARDRGLDRAAVEALEPPPGTVLHDTCMG